MTGIKNGYRVDNLLNQSHNSNITIFELKILFVKNISFGQNAKRVSKYWYKNGVPHRDDDCPAVVYHIWFKNGKFINSKQTYIYEE